MLFWVSYMHVFNIFVFALVQHNSACFSWKGTRNTLIIIVIIVVVVVAVIPFFMSTASGLSLDSIYKCLNRTILFQLSRPVDTVAGQAGILDALHTLTNNRSLVFGPSNYDHEFLACLSFCLLHLTDDPDMG